MTMTWFFSVAFGVGFVVTQVAGVATTIYLHRAVTHRAMILHPVVVWGFRLALWLTTGIIVKEWVAVHRKHHAFTDEDGDPHSPKLKGFWKVQLGNVFYYIRETRDREVMAKYSRDLTDDWWDQHLFKYGLSGVAVGTGVLCVAMASWLGLIGVALGLAAASIHAFLYVFVFSSSVNGLCHTVGYKNFENTATNIRVVALLTGGEGLHNNHHAFPKSPKLSVRRSELDPAWPIIKALTALRLAKPAKTIEEWLTES